MDRPRFASWMIPLIMGYSLISAAMILPVVPRLELEDLLRVEPWLLFGPSTALWFLLFWCGVGLLKAKTSSRQRGLLIAGLLALGSFASLVGSQMDENARFLSPAVSKSFALYSIESTLSGFASLPELDLDSIHVILTLSDLAVLVLVLSFLASKDVKAWTSAAQQNDESEDHGSP